MQLFNTYTKYDINLVSGEGIILTDVEGKEYKDFYGGHGVISIGHSHPHYLFRLENQMKCLGFYSNVVENKLQDQLAEKLGELSGYTDYNLFLCNSGAEANENALKLAAFHTGKSKVIAIKGAFHGRTGGALAVTDDAKLASNYNAKHNVVFIEMNDTEALKTELEKGDVAGFIIEGIQGVNGVVIPETKFLKEAESLCQKYSALFILDEIQSGYGRTGMFFAHQHADIKADIITTAKGMGNGFPLAGVLIHPKIEGKSGLLGTTFGGNHLACAAGIAVLEVMKEEKLIDNAAKVGQYLEDELKKLVGEKALRAQGLMIGVDLENMAEIKSALLFEKGYFTGASGKKTLRLLPPLTLSMTESETFISEFSSLIKKQ
ncbi:aspartate aminotransferase family protein [Ancylomarina euxinus]|uniref:Aspartate aminotransferase family protein n=1 Tax=Ancylomarina euxinus TaxID=2283627 RepID=A0A425Y2N6_9BACT|nr:aminotransferase class III-fold pyridoxal phosphate-dependent enzyme [Ancylomarina euxinus]MCZ4694920.1 aminotransferase class III-fold pyridoxal phosphate-dependent enzyme [Ancylomarina euxinus]MUP14786.1 aminotransferase class III-fold pyridoxal phosphate-dependent enzyme [Ancylomarina euxinus]RRG22131.1 aspartate aminotransferase family protein [Ancylomarina euxinus]